MMLHQGMFQAALCSQMVFNDDIFQITLLNMFLWWNGVCGEKEIWIMVDQVKSPYFILSFLHISCIDFALPVFFVDTRQNGYSSHSLRIPFRKSRFMVFTSSCPWFPNSCTCRGFVYRYVIFPAISLGSGFTMKPFIPS